MQGPNRAGYAGRRALSKRLAGCHHVAQYSDVHQPASEDLDGHFTTSVPPRSPLCVPDQKQAPVPRGP
jgi:hypothetical protein